MRHINCGHMKVNFTFSRPELDYFMEDLECAPCTYNEDANTNAACYTIKSEMQEKVFE